MFAFIKAFFKERARDNKTLDPLHSVSAIDIVHHHRSSIRYDPELIAVLRADHEELIELLARVWSEGFELQSNDSISLLLAEFKRKFQAHLLKENVKFYAFLEQSLESDSESLQLVKNFRVDMNEIANAAIRFCKKYQDGDIFDRRDAWHAFEKDYVEVRKILSQRFELEEQDLYLLYQAELENIS